MFKTSTSRVLSLQHILREMDVALDAEIKVQENEGGSYKHSAVDGKPLGEQSGQYLYLYTFSLKEPREFNDDTPIKIQVNNAPGIKAIIVTSTGTAITIATEKALSLEALQEITLYDDSVELLKTLKKALPESKEGNLHLGSKTFGSEVPRSGKISSSIPLTIFEPDASQQMAIQMALGSEVTYIIGPPGTGKTVTLATIALDHLLAGRTVLITAHTNIAVDNAIKQLANFCKRSEAKAISYLHKGQVARFGAVQLDDLKKPEYEYVYLPAIIKRRSADYQRVKETLEVEQKELETLLSELEQNINQWRSARQKLVAHYNQRQQVRQELSTVRYKLESQIKQSSDLEQAKEQLSIQHINISKQYTVTQQMNKVELFLKHKKPKSLLQNLVSIEQKIRMIGHEQASIEFDKSHGLDYLSQLQEQEEILTSWITYILSQIQISSINMQNIYGLQTRSASVEQQIQFHDNQEREKQSQASILKRQIADTNQKLDTVQEALKQIEKSIVADAKVVATTLSKTYMSSVLSERRFDVVIIDEVSMAPLPAIYIAASRADSSVVAVGDPQQLAPIYNAKNNKNKKLSEEELWLAKSWLGTDLFFKNGITLEEAAKENGFSNSTILTQQSRMHREISAIARNHVYNLKKVILQDHSTRVPTTELDQVSPLPGKHLVLCDTSDASPIAVRPGSSRINIYHALCSVAVARQAVLTLPIDHDQQGKQRIGIVTPYQKQSKLLQNLINDAGLQKYVRVGTVHKFQGLEFDVVIFDTVESPHENPRFEFIAGGKETEALRLINVAVTRARHKLIIVANANHILTERNKLSHELIFPENSILRKAIEEARKVGWVNSLDILDSPSDLAPLTSASHPHRRQWENLTGTNTFDMDLLYEERLNEKTFYSRFKQDIQSAKKEIVIVSPYLANRTKELLPDLEAKLKEGVSVVVVVNPLNPLYGMEKLLKQASIKVLEYTKAHMKHAFIDGEIIYDGSLNILSHKDTHESMIRKRSPRSAKMVWDELYKEIKKETREQLEQNIQARKRLEDQGADFKVRILELPTIQSRCIHCSGEMIPRMNKTTGHPFFGCKNWTPAHSRYSIQVGDNHLMCIPSLSTITCRCNNMMQPKKFGDTLWLECAGEIPCEYWRNIIFIR